MRIRYIQSYNSGSILEENQQVIRDIILRYDHGKLH